MIFNNFLSASLSTAYPNDDKILFYTGEIIGFITSEDLEKEKFTFRSYTASNRLLKKSQLQILKKSFAIGSLFL
ncbi:hypothetical protein FDF23_06975 [Fusobacterium nucleatum]|jgi:hypothetical protein|nr:hypothetical protein [Fusobacterium nucleatum]MBW9311367.1 hypothetical protein [Fusobacterium nucleatum]